MKFTILINEGPYQHQASDTAYHFTRAALEKGHEIYRVFFYHDGVNNGTELAIAPQDDRDIIANWIKLKQQYQLDLVICVAAAQRRGLINEDIKTRQGKNACNLHPAFRISGLGQLVEGTNMSDRTISFGD